MTTKVKITVQPSSEHPQVMDVKDAMQQVLDFFDALTDDQDAGTFVWNLTFAATNSPFTAEAEAVSFDTSVNIDPVARARVAEAAQYLEDVSNGRPPARPLTRRRRESIRRVLKRNTNGIGRTVARFQSLSAEPVTLTPKIALVALETIDAADASAFDLLPAKRQRKEVGSIEGTLVAVATDYNRPAIRVCERKSGLEIVCRIDGRVQETIAQAASFVDVWAHRRVVVRGTLHYDSEGRLTRVDATSIRTVTPREMTPRDIEDIHFTGDDATLDYLEKLREGGLG